MDHDGVTGAFPMNSEHDQAVRFLQIYLKVRGAGADIPYRIAEEFEKTVSGSRLSEALLRDLASDPYWKVRGAVARNPGCPEDLFRLFAGDAEWWVRVAVARNPNCPVYVLRSLAKDAEPLVREGVALNPNCPEDLLRSLARDGIWEVRYTARDNLSDKANPNTNLAAAHSFHIPDKYVAVFASPVDPDAALAAIRRQGKDRQFLQAALVANPATPSELLRRLLRYKNQIAWKLIAEHPNADDNLRAAVARKFLMAA